jgi:hypothetical protein
MNMKRAILALLLLLMLAMIAAFSVSCGVVGANVRLETLTLGTIAMEGKQLTGLPSDKINLDLDVAAQTIKVRTSANGTTLTLIPSGASIEITGDTVSFKGFKPNQVKVEWSVKSQE